MRVNLLRISAAGVLAAGLLAGCGGGEDTGTDTGAENGTTTDAGTGMTGESPTGASPDTSAPAEDAALETVTTAETDLGTILVDGEGLTLYLFTNDSPGMSVCEGECLVAWPPLGEATAGEGVDAALLGTITRSDGSTQASYGDWPLYYYAEDVAAGDTTGQGVGGVWWVIGPDGEAIGAETPGMPTS